MKTLILLLSLFSATAFAGAKYTPDKSFDPMSAEEQKEFDEKMDEFVDRVCGWDMQIVNAKKAIDHEKKVEKLTGVYSKSALHDAGSLVIKLEEMREPVVTNMKNVMGSGFKYSCEGF